MTCNFEQSITNIVLCTNRPRDRIRWSWHKTPFETANEVVRFMWKQTFSTQHEDSRIAPIPLMLGSSFWPPPLKDGPNAGRRCWLVIINVSVASNAKNLEKMAKPLIIWLLEYVGFKRMNENAGSKHHGDSCVYCFAFYILITRTN